MLGRKAHGRIAPSAGEDHNRWHWWHPRRHLTAFVHRLRRDSLLRNSFFIMVNTVVTSALGFVFWLVAARLSSAHAVGLTAAITSASTIVVLSSVLGVGGTLIHSLPGQTRDSGWSTIFWTGIAMATIFAMVLCGLALVFVPLVSSELNVLRTFSYAAVFAVGTVALAVGSTLDSVYIAERRTIDMLSRNSAAAAVKVVLLGLLGLVAGADAVRLLGTWAVASVFGLGLGAALLIRYAHVARPPALPVLIRTAVGLRSRVTGHQLIGIGAGLLPYLLPVLVTVRLSASDNAYFFTTWMMAGLFLIVAPALSQSLFAEGMHRTDETEALVRSAIKIIGAILLPGLVGIIVLGGTVLSAFGPDYADHGVGLLRIAVLASIPDAVTNVYVAVLRVRGRLTAAASLNLAMGLGTLVISWLLLPAMGISAVGVAFFAMQLCGCVYVFLDRHKQTVAERLQSGRRTGETS